MSGFDQAAVERIYRNWSKIYDWLTPFCILGNEKRLRHETIDCLLLQPVQAVLDVACGTGRNFPLILEQIGPTGRLVGVDNTGAMLAHAQERVRDDGQKNVELIQADAARLDLRCTFNAVLCTLAISVIPNYRGALDRMVSHMEPGGWLAIGDAKRSSLWYGRPLNWMADLLGYGADEEMTRRPCESLREMLSDFHYKECFSGFFYVAGGNIPDA